MPAVPATRPPVLAALILAWSCVAHSAQPDLASLPLDRLLDMEVSGASRYSQRQSDSAASATVITADEIRAFGWRTLGQALRSVRGVVIATDRIYDYIGVRGFYAAGDYNARVLLLVDGKRVNDALYDQAYLGDEFPLDLALVERIEFVPGAGSAVYGANALFGVVNVVTRHPAAATPFAAAMRLGSGGHREWRLGAAGELAGGALQVSASRQRADGEDLFLVGAGWSSDTDFTRRDALQLRYDRGPWRASVVHSVREKGVPLYPSTIFGDPATFYRDTQNLADVEWHTPLGERAELTARTHLGHYGFLGDYAMDYPPRTINRDIGRGRWWGLEARVLATLWPGHTVVAGAEFTRHAELWQRNLDMDPARSVYLDDRRRGWRAALYAEDRVDLAPRLAANLGLRVDDANGQRVQVSPRLALNWRARDTLVAKAIFGSAFRPPNAFEAAYDVEGPGGWRRNPSLGPERVRSAELALEWLPESRERGDTRLAASLFHQRAARLLALHYDADADLYEFRNGAGQSTRGVELEVAHAWRHGATLRANVMLQHTHGEPATAEGFPRRMAKLALAWPLPAGWTLGVEGQAMSRRGAAPGHAVAHAALSTRRLATIGDGRVGLTLGVRNLFDRDVVDPGFDRLRQPLMPLPGRQWQLELDVAY